LGDERDRWLPVACRHRVLHRPILSGSNEAGSAIGYAETRYIRRTGARVGQHPGEIPRRQNARLSRGSEH